MIENNCRLRLLLVLLAATLKLSIRPATSSLDDHRYNVGDPVPFFANKVGPLNNPSETYQYFDLPFCCPEPLIKKKESFGEVLNGDRLTNSLYEVNFRENKYGATLCQKKLKKDDVAKFRGAVSGDYYFQMYCDDLPLWGFIGKVEEGNQSINENGLSYYLFSHVQFDILYNGNQVIEVKAFSDPNYTVDISEDADINVVLTYSVLWNATSAQFKSRMDKYSRASLLPTHWKIHWFSIINSVVIIVFLLGLLNLLFLQRLKNDLRKTSVGNEEEEKEAGWKYVRGDVFRYPHYLALFSAILGSGTQFLTLVLGLFILAFLGIFYPYNRGALCTSLVIIYTLASVVAGFAAAAFHSQLAETGWERAVLLTGIIYIGPLLIIVSVLNTISIFYGATAALPIGTILLVLIVYFFVAIPLLILGGLIGYWSRSEFQAPCATMRFPREIPPREWYRKTPAQMFICGLLPFSAIVLELHHLYASLWGYKICTSYSILFIMFVILLILTAILSVGLTYIQLSVEDHEWWWRSLLRGGSAAVFMFGYSICFYAKSNMSGFMQLSSFFGYNACLCYAFFLMLGTISFRASLMFVLHIYGAVKSE